MIVLTLNGQTKTIAEWARETGINRSLLWGRLKRGWPIERVLAKEDGRSTRTNRRRRDNRMLEYKGETKPICEWAREFKILTSTINVRLKRGWSVKKALTTPVSMQADYDGLTSKYPSEFWIWQGMIRRCHNPDHSEFRNYGGRGIRVCKRWRKSFKKFLKDMGRRPGNKEIDRIDNDGDYRPENCRWATRSEQCRNKRGNRIIEFEGESKCLAEWAEVVGIRMATLWRRLNQGWSFEKAISIPVGGMFGPGKGTLKGRK